jgi:hypothetical protein
MASPRNQPELDHLAAIYAEATRALRAGDLARAEAELTAAEQLLSSAAGPARAGSTDAVAVALTELRASVSRQLQDLVASRQLLGDHRRALAGYQRALG